jgi:hypothetical protein
MVSRIVAPLLAPAPLKPVEREPTRDKLFLADRRYWQAVALAVDQGANAQPQPSAERAEGKNLIGVDGVAGGLGGRFEGASGHRAPPLGSPRESDRVWSLRTLSFSARIASRSMERRRFASRMFSDNRSRISSAGGIRETGLSELTFMLGSETNERI